MQAGSDTAPSWPLVAVLRQLAVGLGVHRLYGGGSTPAGGEAADRVAELARPVLAAEGVATVLLRAGRVVGVDGDEMVDRFAAACFERRVEVLWITGVPSAEELAHLFGALSTDPGEVEAAGGVQALLERSGVSSLRTAEDAPDPASGEEVPEELLAAADWAGVVEDRALEEALALGVTAATDAAALYGRLSSAASHLPDDAVARSPFYRHAADLAAELSADERARFDRLVLDHAASDAFAERLLGHLSDTDVADLVGRVARAEGADPRELAWLVRNVGGRHANLPRLVMERQLARNVGDGEERSHTSMSSAAIPRGSHPLATAFPADGEAGRRLAATALIDVLANDPREDHLAQIADAVVRQLRADVVVGDRAGLEVLLAAWERGAAELPPDRSRLLPAALDGVLEAEVVAGALAAGPASAINVLGPFGARAVDPLLALLEPHHDEVVRTASAEALRAVLPFHLGAVAGAVGPRSAGARRTLLKVLRRLPGDEVVPVVARVAQHRDAGLLHEALEVLASRNADTSAPVVGAIVTRSDDRDVQLRGLEVLAARPVPAARRLLQQLSDRGTSPLPAPVRRQARRLSKESS